MKSAYTGSHRPTCLSAIALAARADRKRRGVGQFDAQLLRETFEAYRAQAAQILHTAPEGMVLIIMHVSSGMTAGNAAAARFGEAAAARMGAPRAHVATAVVVLEWLEELGEYAHAAALRGALVGGRVVVLCGVSVAVRHV